MPSLSIGQAVYSVVTAGMKMDITGVFSIHLVGQFHACPGQKFVYISNMSEKMKILLCFVLLLGSLGRLLNLTFLKKYLQRKKPEQPTPTSGVDRSGYLVSRIRIRCSVACLITDKQAGTATVSCGPSARYTKVKSVYLSAVYNEIFYGACSRILPRRISHI